MKIRPVGLILALCITALAVYIFHVLGGSGNTPLLVCGGLSVLITSVMGLSVAIKGYKRTTSINMLVSMLFCSMSWVVNIIISLVAPASVPLIVIVNAGLLLTYALMAWGVLRAKQ